MSRARSRRFLVPLLFVFTAIVLTLVFGMGRLISQSEGPSSYRFDESLIARTDANLRRHVRALATDIGVRHFGRPGSLEKTVRYIESEFN